MRIPPAGEGFEPRAERYTKGGFSAAYAVPLNPLHGSNVVDPVRGELMDRA